MQVTALPWKEAYQLHQSVWRKHATKGVLLGHLLEYYQGFFYGVSGTRFGFLELKIGSLESEKINVGSLESEKIGSLESEKTGSLQVHTGDLTFSLKKTWYYNNSF